MHSATGLETTIYLDITGSLDDDVLQVKACLMSSSSLQVSGVLTGIPSLKKALQALGQNYQALKNVGLRIRPEVAGYLPDHHASLVVIQAQHRQLIELFQSILADKGFTKIHEFCLSHFSPKQNQQQLCISTDDLLIYKLPWEHWSLFNQFPDLGCSVVSRKRTQPPAVILPNYAKPKYFPERLKALMILGNDQGLDLDQDYKIAQRYVDVSVERRPDLGTLCDRLRDEAWDILIFSGHGSTIDHQGILELNQFDRASAADLWKALRDAVTRGLKLAIFNACEGLGFVEDLDDASIPSVVLMRDYLPDNIAQRFLDQFLRSLTAGSSPYAALSIARDRLKEKYESQVPCATFPCASWLPILYHHPGVDVAAWEPLILPNDEPRDWSLIDYPESKAEPQIERIIPTQSSKILGSQQQVNPELARLQVGYNHLFSHVSQNRKWLAASLIVIMTGTLGLKYFLSPILGKAATDQAVSSKLQDNLPMMDQWMKVSFLIDPDLAYTHLVQGQICDWVRPDEVCAINHYGIAQESGSLDAGSQWILLRMKQWDEQYNRQSRLTDQARQELQVIGVDSVRIVDSYEKRKPQDPRIGAPIYKNHGWFLLRQKRLIEAENFLKKARKEFSKITDENRENAHFYCLWAELLEAKGEPRSALVYWEKITHLPPDRVHYPLEQVCAQKANQRLLIGKTF